MENINVTLGIDESSFEAIADKVSEIMNITDKVDEVISEIDLDGKINDRIDDYDFADKIEEGIDNFDFDNKIESWIDYNLDIDDNVKDIVSRMNLAEYIDSDDIDIEDSVRSLMNSFSPINACSTGKAAMDVIQSTIRYLLLKDEDFVNDISKAIKKHELAQIIDEEKSKAIDAAKPSIIEDFKRELKEYSDEITRQKTLESNPAINNITYTAWQ